MDNNYDNSYKINRNIHEKDDKIIMTTIHVEPHNYTAHVHVSSIGWAVKFEE